MTRGTSVATATSSGADEHGSVRSLYTVCVRFHHIATGRPLKAAVAVQPETTAKLQAQLDTRATHPFIVEDEAPIQFRRSMDYGDYEVSIKALRVAERSVKRGKTVFSTLTWRVPECFVPKRDALPIITNAGNHYVELDDRKKLYVCVQTGDGKLARRALITRLDGVLEIPLTPDQWKKGTTLTLKLRDYKVLDVKEAIEPAEYTPSWEKVTLNGKPVDNDWKLKTADGEVSFKDETTLEIGPEDAKHDEHSEAFDLRGDAHVYWAIRRVTTYDEQQYPPAWKTRPAGELKPKGVMIHYNSGGSTSEKFEAERGQERLSIVASGKRSLRRVQKRGAGNWSRQKTTYRDGDLEEPNFAQECRLEFELRLIMAHLWHTEVHGCTTAIASGPKKIAYHEKRVAKAARRVARAEERVAKREARVEEAEAKCKEKPKSRSAKKKLRAARRKLRWAKRAEKRAKKPQADLARARTNLKRAERKKSRLLANELTPQLGYQFHIGRSGMILSVVDEESRTHHAGSTRKPLVLEAMPPGGEEGPTSRQLTAPDKRWPRNFNARAIGIDLIGHGLNELHHFNEEQVFYCNCLIANLQRRFGFAWHDILGHDEASTMHLIRSTNKKLGAKEGDKEQIDNWYVDLEEVNAQVAAFNADVETYNDEAKAFNKGRKKKRRRLKKELKPVKPRKQDPGEALEMGMPALRWIHGGREASEEE